MCCERCESHANEIDELVAEWGKEVKELKAELESLRLRVWELEQQLEFSKAAHSADSKVLRVLQDYNVKLQAVVDVAYDVWRFVVFRSNEKEYEEALEKALIPVKKEVRDVLSSLKDDVSPSGEKEK